MTERGALIVGSTLAAMVISSVAVSLVLWDLKPGRIEEISWWRIQTLTVVPATIAAAVASAWSSGRRYWPKLDALEQTLCISLNSYVLYGLFIVVLFCADQILRGGPSDSNILEIFGLTVMVAALMTFAAMIVTGLPVFITEYMIVRFARRRSQPALSSEVAP